MNRRYASSPLVALLLFFTFVTLFSVEFAAANEGIGVSYDQTLVYLSQFFSMEKSAPVDGENRYMGLTPDETAVLEIIGKKHNISMATILIGFPSDNSKILIRNTAILLRFIKNTVPEWGVESEEFRRLLELAKDSPNVFREIIRGNKKITVMFIPFLGGFSVSVKPQ